jgi:RTX calcium-binding nonapeptide repeat (4 copies)
MRQRAARLALALVVAGSAATLLSGWVVIRQVPAPIPGPRIDDETLTQPGVIGPVEIQTTLCASDGTPSCPNGASGAPLPGGNIQMLVAYRIRTDVVAPASFTATAAGQAVTFAADAGYAAELNRLSPPPAGSQWVGYLSTPAIFQLNAGDTVTIRPRFALTPSGGAPFASPFTYRTVVGARQVTGALPATRPVVCGPTFGSVGDGGSTHCADAPAAGFAAKNRAVRDLAAIPVANGTGAPGGTAAATFRLDFAGDADPSVASFALTTATTVPGGTAQVTGGGAVFMPLVTDEDRDVPILVTIPPGTPPGSYAVTLTARIGSDATLQTRTATAQVAVTTRAPDDTPSKGDRVICQGKRATIVGTARADKLKGTRKADVIAAGGGNDKVSARGGADRVCGGKGRDRLNGGPGADRLAGQQGTDRLTGGGGRDRLNGGPKRDRCAGGSGRDRARGCERRRSI